MSTITIDNQQPSSLTHGGDGKGSTTIPQGSTGKKIAGKRSVFLNKHNVIYMLLNIKTKKFYIGSAAHYGNRMAHHITYLRRGKHKNIFLQRAWNKYGEESFEYYILEEVNLSINTLLNREQYYLDFYKPYDQIIGYNLCSLASRNRFGMKMPESAKKKIGDFWRGKRFSNQRRREHKKRITLNQGKPVLVYNTKGSLMYEFPSRSETARALNISVAAISKQCKKGGKKFMTKGHKYIFKNKDIV